MTRMFLVEVMGKREFLYQPDIEKLQKDGIFQVDVLEEMTDLEIEAIETRNRIVGTAKRMMAK